MAGDPSRYSPPLPSTAPAGTLPDYQINDIDRVRGTSRCHPFPTPGQTGPYHRASTKLS